MGEIQKRHSAAQHKGHCSVFVGFPDKSGKQGRQGRRHIRENYLGQISPRCSGGRKLRPLLRSFARHGDHGHIGHIGEIPDHMAGHRGNDNYRDRNRPASHLNKLEGVQERDDPWKQNQPGTIASPFLWFDTVEDRAVDPGKPGINRAGNSSDHGHHSQGESRQIGQKDIEEITLHIAHESKSAVSHTVKQFQGAAQAFALFGRARFVVLRTHINLSFLPLIVQSFVD